MFLYKFKEIIKFLKAEKYTSVTITYKRKII